MLKKNSVAVEGQIQDVYSRSTKMSMGDPAKYGAQYGVLTFRGGPLRQNAAYGKFSVREDVKAAEAEGAEIRPKLVLGRSSRTIKLADGSTGFGFGSQPIIIKWPKVIREMMNLYPQYVTVADGKNPMKEVIVPSSDGKIYFFDLESQAPSRDTINIGMSLNTTASVSPYGYPLLYVGQTASTMTVLYSENKREMNDNQRSTKQSVTGNTGVRTFSLIDQTLAGFETTLNPVATYADKLEVYSSPLVYVDPQSHSDTLLYTAANGLVYAVEQNVDFDLDQKQIAVTPKDTTYGYTTKLKNDPKLGIRTSVAAYGDYVFFGDMNGSLQCVDMNTMSPVWIRDLGDSIVATPTLEVEDENHVWLYIGTVINKGKKSVKAHMMKINALNGDLVWDTATEQNGLFASKTAKLGLYAGVQASPLVGEGDIDDLVVFNVNRLQIDKKTQSAIVYALDKSTGEVIWQQILDAESVSSPIALYRKDTNTSYIVMGDDGGTLRVMDGYNGITLDSLNLGGPIQASPAAYEEHIVVGNTTGQVFFVDLELQKAQ